MKYILEKLLEKKGSSKNLAYELIEAGMPYDEEEVDKLAVLIRKWKQKGRVPEKWNEYIEEMAKNLGIHYLDEKDEKLLESVFVNFLKEIKISFYENNKKLEKEEVFILFVFILVLDNDVVSKHIEREWGNLYEKLNIEENE